MDHRSGSFLSSVSSFAVTNDDLDIQTYAILSRVISFLDFAPVSRLVLYWFVVCNVFRFSSQTPRLRAAVDFYLDFVGGRYHGGLKIPELDVG